MHRVSADVKNYRPISKLELGERKLSY